MSYELPPLPYDRDALEPHMSAETLDYHYGKHHRTYVDNLNKFVVGTEYEGRSLEEVVKTSDGRDKKIFNNAAQIWNHSFFWESLTPAKVAVPPELAKAIDDSFGSFDKFRETFIEEGKGHFGSGWAWLVREPDGKLAVTSTHDAGTPITGDSTPLFVADVWEHAYYIDTRNNRAAYLEAMFDNLADWDRAAKRLADAG